ncbi:FAD-dependent oxidoreductase [Ruminococcaceae bacterium OttesenSCG-928-N02]|nr:FAD-dependent oxidoreductase [Ruminococcaceae bacterium OttesenSCG-928-N02]
MKVLIVGGVAGGAGTAARLRRNDEFAQIILFEKGEYISFANCGLPYYIGGAIQNKAALQLQTPASFNARFAVDVRVQSEVTAVDTQGKTITVRNHANGAEYTEGYDVLVLSPGARAVHPALPGAGAENVFTLRNIPDTYKIKEYIEQKAPKTAVVIGGGFIGVEMAENLLDAGLDVSIVEAQSHLFGNLDEDMCYDLHEHLRAQGVHLHVNARVAEIQPGKVLLAGGEELAADMVIMSVGVRAATDFLQGSGIALNERGEILVDEQMRTNCPGVYALGDAAAIRQFTSGAMGSIPLAGPANRQARLLADVIAGKDARYKGAQGTSIAKVCGMAAASMGLNEGQLKAAGIAYKKTFTYPQSHASYYPGAKPMFIKLLYTPEGEILGAQITGYEGVDKRMDVLATAQRAGLTVHDLCELELSYAPPFSSAKDPVNFAGYVASNVLDGSMRPFFIEDIATIPAEVTKVDVRTKGEYERGSIDGFVNIPVDDLRQSLNQIPKDAPVYITCQVGQRGYIAEQILRQNGYDVYNLSGGYRHYAAWQKDAAAK